MPPSSPAPAVAVIDLGSNSIKLLVARRAGDGALEELAQHTRETRLGTGISGQPPRLTEDAMTRVLESVRALLQTAAPFAPGQVRLVATSAVRDAANADDFRERVRRATGHDLQVLSGEEEARLIGRGIKCERALHDEPAFYVFDLGGGSLEMLTFLDGHPQQVASLPLGCVRLTETCVSHVEQPLPEADAERIRDRVRSVIKDSGFRFDLPPESPVIITGGTAATLRAMRAAAWGRALAIESPVLAATEIQRFALRLSEMSLAERKRAPGLPEARADVFPTAVITLQELARLAGVPAFRHSFYNLRYGLAAELLAAGPIHPSPSSAE